MGEPITFLGDEVASGHLWGVRNRSGEQLPALGLNSRFSCSQPDPQSAGVPLHCLDGCVGPLPTCMSSVVPSLHVCTPRVLGCPTCPFSCRTAAACSLLAPSSVILPLSATQLVLPRPAHLLLHLWCYPVLFFDTFRTGQPETHGSAAGGVPKPYSM